jgi:hypothetical protein
MATEQVLMCDNKLAGADLSTAQYKIVKLSGANAVLASAAGELAYGVLQNAPVAGDAAGIAIGGRTKIQLGATLAAGAKFSTSAAGLAIAAISTHQVLGTIVEGGASGEIGSAVIDLNGVLA